MFRRSVLCCVHRPKSTLLCHCEFALSQHDSAGSCLSSAMVLSPTPGCWKDFGQKDHAIQLAQATSLHSHGCKVALPKDFA